jgi:hypothetical protein
MTDGGSGAERRVWAALPVGAREELERGLSPTDLQTMLLAVARVRAAAVTPSQVLRRWQSDRFVRPAAADPRRLAALEARLWQLLPDAIVGVELSPVVPLGTCTAVTPLSQNRIVSTARSTEVISDSTNALAVEAVVRRREQSAEGEVHLAACQRQLRAQSFGAGSAAHFRLFALVSSARDTGSARTEAQLLIRHLSFWRDLLAELIPDANPRIELTVFDSPTLGDRLQDTVIPAFAGASNAVDVVEAPQRTVGRGYYVAGAVRLAARDGTIELGDGGFTTWTAQLSGDAKERCLVSCIATERLAELVEP